MKNKVGQKIKSLRLKIGVGQRQFAEKLGVSRSGIAQIESGKTCPSFELVHKIYQFYKVEPAYFFETENIENSFRLISNSEKQQNTAAIGVNEKVIQLKMKDKACQNLRVLRFKLNFTQEEFSNMIGISQSYFAMLEKGKRKPNRLMLIEIIKRFGLESNYFEKDTEQNFDGQELTLDTSSCNFIKIKEDLTQLFTGLSLLTIEIQENGGAVPFNAHDGLLALSQVIEMLSERDKNN